MMMIIINVTTSKQQYLIMIDNNDSEKYDDHSEWGDVIPVVSLPICECMCLDITVIQYFLY